jgi:hypothetical protein
MADQPLLKDFYDKPLISIGPNDRASIVNDQNKQDTQSITHWLVALIWLETQFEKGWKVAVYPVCQGKRDWDQIPYYQSQIIHSYERALQLSKIIDDFARRDLLTSPSFHQQIHQFLKG